MRSPYLPVAAILIVASWVPPARSQLLPSQAKGAARTQVVMLSVKGGCAAGIIVGYDEKAIYVATAAHIADLSTPPFPPVAVKFEGLSSSPRNGTFLPKFETKEKGDLAVVIVDRDDSLNKFLNELDFAMLSPVSLGAADAPVISIGCFGGGEWSSGSNETLLAPDQGYLRFQSDVGEGQSGGGLYNEAWELIGMPLDEGPNGIYARPIAQILEDLRKWKVPVLLTLRPLMERARGADEIARERERESKARELAAFSTESLREDPEKSIILGMQAVNATLRFGQPPVPAAEEALHQAILSSRVRVTLRGHSHPVYSVAFSPDGKRLATAGHDQTAKVWDAESGKILLTLSGHSGPVFGVAFSPDGKRMATAGNDQTAKVWDAVRGENLLTLRGHTAVVWSVAFSHDGRYLATSSFDDTAKVWDAESGKELLTLRSQSDDSISPFMGVAISPDGKRIATSSGNGTATLWDAENGKELLTLRGHSTGILGSVNGVAFSPDGTRLATASSDDTAKVWDTESGKELLTLRGHLGGVLSVAFSSDGKRLATAGGDGTAKVWDAESGKELLTLRGHSRGVNCVAFSPDGKRLATASTDDTAKVWGTESDEELLTLSGHSGPLNGVVFSPDGKRFATAGHDQTAKVWDAESGKILLTLSGHSGPVFGVAFSPDGKRLATASGDGTAKVWDTESGKESVILKEWKTESDDGAGGDASSSIRVTASRDRSVLSVAFSPDGKRLFTTSADESATIWDAESGEELLPFRGNSRGAQSVAFSPNGKRVFVGTEDKTAILLDLGKILSELDAGKTADESWRSIRLLLTLRGDLSNVHVVAFSPDSKRLLAASGVQAEIWDGESGEALLALHGHSGSVNSSAFSPDGKRVATASDDQTAKVWDTESGKELLTLRGHSGPVKGVAFSPDGKRLATASEDGAVQVYAFDLRELLNLARSRVTRTFTVEECQRYFQSETCPPLP